METVIESKYPFEDILTSPYIEQIRSITVHPETGIVYAGDIDTPRILKLVPGDRASVLAGNGFFGYSPGFRTSAVISDPESMIFLNNQTIIIADAGYNVLLQMNLDGYVSLFAGSPSSATLTTYKDGKLSEATFAAPVALAKNNDGSIIYVSQSSLVREINLGKFLNDSKHFFSTLIGTGMIKTIAGGKTTGYKDGAGKDAQFNGIFSLYVGRSSGNLYMSDYYNHAIRVYFPSNGTVSTIVGKKGGGYNDGNIETAKLNGPWGIALDLKENIYVSDYANNAIRKIGIDGTVSTMAGGESSGFYDGVGKDAQLYWPTVMAIDEKGETLYMGEFGNGDIRKLVISTRFLTTFAVREGMGNEDGKGSDVRLCYPSFFGIDDKKRIFFSNIISSQMKYVY